MSLSFVKASSLRPSSASYTLAPLKSRLSRELGTSNTEFSLLISAFSLNGTWTPLIGGMLASKLGTTLASIFATGVVFLGRRRILLSCALLSRSAKVRCSFFLERHKKVSV